MKAVGHVQYDDTLELGIDSDVSAGSAASQICSIAFSLWLKAGHSEGATKIVIKITDQALLAVPRSRC